MLYSPKPLDTSGVILDHQLTELLEVLARNTHEVWASQRLADGWRYGPHRNDGKKEHPGLVEYDELSETEKDYDRVVALQVIKSILALGFRIEAPAHIAMALNSEPGRSEG